MQIAVEARYLAGNRTGVGRYLLNLLRFLPQLSNEHEYFLYSDRLMEQPIVDDNIHYRILKGHRLLWKHILLPIEQRKKQIDLMFIPSYSAPLLNLGKTIVTIHDLIATRHPEWTTKSQSLRFATVVKYAARKADYIIAVSEMTRKDILELTGVPEDKVKVIYEGVDEHFLKLPSNKLEEFRNKYKLDQPYILYVGSIHPRRNIKRLIEAFIYLKKEKRIEHKLVLIGLVLQQGSQLKDWISESQLEDQILTYGFVPDDDLVKFYNFADIFIYPSLYEGFGLPILEAMACETPVITSNTSSLPEVAGDTAILIDPCDVKQIADAINQLIDDSSLREKLIARGKERCKQFSWRQAAVETLRLFETTC